MIKKQSNYTNYAEYTLFKNTQNMEKKLTICLVIKPQKKIKGYE